MKKPTLTIGIPAYNEEVNIGLLLASILAQKRKYFTLERIIVVSDGSIDRTMEIVKKYQKQFPLILLKHNNYRSGKPSALNKIYTLSSSDFLLTIDADILFQGNDSLDHMMHAMIYNPTLNMVGPLHTPSRSDTFFGNLSRYSYLIFRDAALNINHGNNFYGCMSSEFMRKKFYKSFRIPKGTISDQCYVYAMAIKKKKNGFKLVTNAKVIFGVAQTFRDWRVLSARSVVGDKQDLIKNFGSELLAYYQMPKILYIRSLAKYLLKNPLYALGAVLMNIYIRKFPYNESLYDSGIWQIVSTSKELII